MNEFKVKHMHIIIICINVLKSLSVWSQSDANVNKKEFTYVSPATKITDGKT